MDNRTLLAILLSLVIWYGWLAMFPPEEPPVDEAEVAAAQADGVDSDAAAPEAAPSEPVADAAPRGPIREVDVTLCRAAAQVTTADGSLGAVDLLDHEGPFDIQPLYSWVLSGFSGAWKPYGDDPGLERLLTKNARALAAGAGPLDRTAPWSDVVSSGEGEVVTRGTTAEGVEITRTLTTLPGDPCRIEAKVTWRNTGAAAYDGGLWLGLHDELPEAGGRYAVPLRPKVHVDGYVETLDDPEDLPELEPMAGEVSWFGLADTYFAAFVIPRETTGGRAVFTTTPSHADEALYGVHYVVDAALPPGGSHTERFEVYLGPKELSALTAVDPTLPDAVELGFFSALAWPLLWTLRMIHGVVGNWGLSIIGIVLALKLVFFRLTQRGFESSQAMQMIQPQMQELREKHRDNPEELQKQTMALFQEAGVNPLGGCLPMLVQMPVFFALFSTLMGAAELYHADFLYLHDLSRVDPYMALPTVVMGLMFLQQRFMPTGNMEPSQAMMMKAMPVVFGLFLYSFPAGLALYSFSNLVLSIGQQWYIRRTFERRAAAAEAAT